MAGEACGDATEGQLRWMMRLLADRLVEQTIWDETARRELKRTGLSHGEGDWGATTFSGKFVAAMEEALGLSITPSARRSTSIKYFAINEWHCR